MEDRNYNMGIIGNCNYLALVDSTARIVWMCWPKFDDSFIFGHLLDPEKGGEFAIKPKSPNCSYEQSYIENTNVLQTTVHDGMEGAFRITDFAPRFEHHGRSNKPLMLIRKLEPINGNPNVKVVCEPTGDYGRQSAHIHFGSNHIHYSGIGEPVRLTTNIPLTYIAGQKYFVLDDVKYLILTWGKPFDANIESTAETFLYKTIEYWQRWASQCAISRYFQKEVLRSALVLKLHQFEDTGAIIASATTSLPEAPGSERNWDYRYCWLRDSYYTISALNKMSRFDEMKKFLQYILNIAEEKSGRYAPLYSISGDPVPKEVKLEYLSGYKNHPPVRVGNLASIQIQNDIYGQVLLALLPFYVDERFPGKVKASSQQLVHKILSFIERTQSEPDSTLWEYRGILEKHCYTQLFHWAGAKAAGKIADKLGDEELFKRAIKISSRSRKYIESCYDNEKKTYLPSEGNHYADASLLHLITLGFIPPTSERAKQHLDYLEKGLIINGSMLRYNREDDFGKPEVSFAICSFWYVEALATVGKIDEAFRIFEKMLGHANHLGLFSEDIDEKQNWLWGNFPQTYTHVGLINAAFKLSRAFDYPEFF